MAYVDAKMTQALVATFDNKGVKELRKHKGNSTFFGEILRATGEATITYKPVKRSDGSTELQPLTVMWSDNGTDYFINIMGGIDDK